MTRFNSRRYERQGVSHTPARNQAVTANLDISNKSSSQNTPSHRIEPRDCLALTFATGWVDGKTHNSHTQTLPSLLRMAVSER